MRLRPFHLLFLLSALLAASPADAAVRKPSPKPIFKEATPREKQEDKQAPPPKTAAVKKTGKNISSGEDEETPAPAADIDEALPLPDYPIGARIATGKAETWIAGEEDTLLDVARHFGLGYVEIRAANPDVDPWAPVPGEEILIPAFRLLPRAKQDGIVVNLAEMRMYYFRKPGAEPETFAIGIGRDGLMTPVGETTIVRKVAGPSWHPTDRMRAEKPFLPASVPPGPSNPLGTHAIYLGWPTFLIHGSNKPWAIGRRVSSGCMRMYPEDIARLFGEIAPGTKVTVVEQPILVGWVDDTLYIEANPSRIQSNELEIEGAFAPKELTEGLKKVILDAAGEPAAGLIDWRAAEKAVLERRGYPVAIAEMAPGGKPRRKKAEAPQKFN